MCDQLNIMYAKWNWLKLRAELNGQQNLIVEQLKDMNRARGIYYAFDTIPQKIEKQLRIMANLEPRYADGMIFHFRGGNCEVLEDELSSTKPAHDDVSDAFASVVEIATAPSRRAVSTAPTIVKYHPKHGGIC